MRKSELTREKQRLLWEEKAMQKIKTTVKKTIAYLAKKSANMEANTACPCIGFQPKEPQTVKKLRKF